MGYKDRALCLNCEKTHFADPPQLLPNKLLGVVGRVAQESRMFAHHKDQSLGPNSCVPQKLVTPAPRARPLFNFCMHTSRQAHKPLKRNRLGAGDVAQWLRALTALSKVLSSILRNHMVAHNHL
jgi:hypothetical protein